MKARLYLIAIATVFLASWSVITAKEIDEIPTKCPAKDPKDTVIHLAHETDCTKFYMCHKGKKILRECPIYNKKGDRLHFNPRLQVCDWPWMAGCKHKNFDEDQNFAMSVEFVAQKHHNRVARLVNNESKCPDSNPDNTTILLPHEYDCTKFYMCLGREKIERVCPFMNKKGDRLHFNPHKKECDWPDTAGCDKNLNKDQVETNIEQSISDDQEEGELWENGSLEIPTKCPAKDPKDTTIHLAHETDCTKFYTCHKGKKILRECPIYNKKGDRLHFNPHLQVCDWPWSAGCKQKNFDEDQNFAMSVEFVAQKHHNRVARLVNNESKCPDSNPDNTTILLPHEYDCTKFYMCLGREKIERVCPFMNKKGDRLHFNPHKKECDWPDKAGCDKNLNKDQVETNIEQSISDNQEEGESWENGSSEIPTKCPAKDPMNTTIHLAHEYDCTKFYMCSGGQKILKQCPYMDKQGNRLHFNPRLQVCDWPWSAGCKTNNPTDGECPKDSDGRLLPHECNCAMFYECMNGYKVLRECPDDRYFSKKYQGCVKFEESDCKKKPSAKCSREGELIPHECDCTKYYKCRKNDQVLQKCKDGLHFSPERRKCEHPDKAGCDRDIPNPNPRPGDCPKPTPKLPWRHNCDCRLFFRCENGKQRLYECPWGYYYDAKQNACLPQEQVSCKNSLDE